MQDTLIAPVSHPPTATDPIEVIESARSRRSVIRFADRPADAVTLDELWRDAGQAQRELTDVVGAGSAPAIAIVLRATRPCVTTLLGAWRLGATVVSLPLPTRWITPDEYCDQVTAICRLSGATLVIADRDVCSLLPDLPVAVSAADRFAASTERSAGVPMPIAGGRLIQFSSGTTGRPKGVVLPLTSVGANVDGILGRLDLGRRLSTVSWLPLSHDMGLIGMLLSTLVAMATLPLERGSLTLLHPEEFLADPWSWLRALHDAEGNVTAAPAFALARVAQLAPRGTLDLSMLTTLICGGEPISAGTLRAFDDALRVHGCPPTAVAPAYGMAEATLAVSIDEPSLRWNSREVDTGDDHLTELVGCGRPLDGMEVRVAPTDADDPTCGTTSGTPGRLQVRGPSLLTGYLGAAPTVDGDGWFTTSDLGVVDGDCVRVIGRVDDVLVVRGRNLSALDIEETVRATAARGPIRPGGIAATTDDSGGLVVLIETRPAAAVDDLAHAVATASRAILRRHGVRPTTVTPVAAGTLPRTTSGKLQRTRLTQLLRDGTLGQGEDRPVTPRESGSERGLERGTLPPDVAPSAPRPAPSSTVGGGTT